VHVFSTRRPAVTSPRTQRRSSSEPVVASPRRDIGSTRLLLPLPQSGSPDVIDGDEAFRAGRRRSRSRARSVHWLGHEIPRGHRPAESKKGDAAELQTSDCPLAWPRGSRRSLQVLTQARTMGKETISPPRSSTDYTHVNSTQIPPDLWASAVRQARGGLQRRLAGLADPQDPAYAGQHHIAPCSAPATWARR